MPHSADQTTLGELLESCDYRAINGSVSECYVRGLSLDSRKVTQGDVFFALQGTSANGSAFIKDAVSRGAAAIAVDADYYAAQPTCEDTAVPLVAVTNLRALVGQIAAGFYGYPSRRLTVIAVTGTNGKTTCVWLIASALKGIGQSGACLGTLGLHTKERVATETGLTTPDAINVQKVIGSLVDQNVESLALEASSHALVQDRLAGVEVDIAVLTNVTHDHLDYHGSMESYAAAKIKLFSQPGLSVGILNLDDPRVNLFIDAARCKRLLTYSVTRTDADLYIVSQRIVDERVELVIHSPAGRLNVRSTLLGQFNVENLLAVAAVLIAMDERAETIVQALTQISPAPGRMEVYRSERFSSTRPTVVVDYAHTPDALDKALTAVAEHCQGRITCVFGCGGDRDTAKRPLMGAIAERLADYVILTNDNPRAEDPVSIVADIQNGMTGSAAVEPSRERAIENAITEAGPKDWVLIAGKGHETDQIIGDQRVRFSDRDVVRTFLEAAA